MAIEPAFDPPPIGHLIFACHHLMPWFAGFSVGDSPARRFDDSAEWWSPGGRGFSSSSFGMPTAKKKFSSVTIRMAFLRGEAYAKGKGITHRLISGIDPRRFNSCWTCLHALHTYFSSVKADSALDLYFPLRAITVSSCLSAFLPSLSWRSASALYHSASS